MIPINPHPRPARPTGAAVVNRGTFPAHTPAAALHHCAGFQEEAPHPVYRVVDRDLYLDLAVVLCDAALGGKVMMPPPNDRVALTIPANTRSGQKLCLKKKSLPRRPRIALLLNRNAEHISIRIHRPPEPISFTTDRIGHFVGLPFAAGTGPVALDAIGGMTTEAVDPFPERFPAQVHAALSAQR